MRNLVVGMGLLAATAAPGFAGDAIEQACRTSGRAASAEICSCLQAVADQTLEGSEQRRAAVFFRDPDKAEAKRQSDSSSDEAFWQRYQAFAAAAEYSCAGG